MSKNKNVCFQTEDVIGSSYTLFAHLFVGTILWSLLVFHYNILSNSVPFHLKKYSLSCCELRKNCI